MRRALAGLGAVAVLVTGCADISAADESACDFLSNDRAAARDDDAAARERLLTRMDDGFLDALSDDLRPYFETVVEDAEREARGRDARNFSAHIDDALSVCMDVGW